MNRCAGWDGRIVCTLLQRLSGFLLACANSVHCSNHSLLLPEITSWLEPCPSYHQDVVFLGVQSVCFEGQIKFSCVFLTRLSPVKVKLCRSQWPRGLRHEPSSPARTLGSWLRMPLEAWMSVCVYSVCVVLCVGSDPATG
jgi:hypothetical protein